MPIKLCLLLAFSVLLSACGGGGDGGSSGSSNNTPSAETGVFTDSPVKGLYYSTPTQSGLTNADGEFKYLPGETVTFKLGGTVLGSTQAGTIITPFDLAGILPVRTQREITSKLSSDDFNSFDRVVNIATLLQTFDVDGDPSNNIDLGNAHKLLKNTSINLYVKARSFELRSDLADAKNIAGIINVRGFEPSVQHLYESLEIDVESQQISRFSSAIGNEALSTVDYEYDEEGRLAEERTDNDGDGTPDRVKTFSYDERGNLIRRTNSVNDTVETFSYDESDNLISRLTETDSATNLESYVYNNGLLDRFESDLGADGSIDQTTEYSYDSDGRVTAYTLDTDGDGSVDSASSYLYDNGLVSIFSEDKDNDGTPNFIVAYSYDVRGNRTSHNIDISLDGFPSSLSTFTYDSNDNISRYEQDRDLDGNADYIEAYRYNNEGQRTRYYRDLDADGNWDFVAQYSYDINGNRVAMIEDSDGNGIVDKSWTGNYQANLVEDNLAELLSKL